MPVAYSELLCSTLPRVRHVIAAAAASVGRDPQTVRLIAVTKGHPLAALRAALAAGLSDLGENRIEELAEKVAALRAAEPKSPGKLALGRSRAEPQGQKCRAARGSGAFGRFSEAR